MKSKHVISDVNPEDGTITVSTLTFARPQDAASFERQVRP